MARKRAYRLCSRRYSARSGAGAALHGGRWNFRGVEVIYAASSISLAMLEVLVNYSILPINFGLTEILIPPSLIETKFGLPSKLPEGWDSPVPGRLTQEIGDRWIRSAKSTVLAVPSTIVHDELNYVLNPTSQDFANIEFGPARPFSFDTRLK